MLKACSSEANMLVQYHPKTEGCLMLHFGDVHTVSKFPSSHPPECQS